MYNCVSQFSRLVLTAALGASLAACSRTPTAQASKRDGDPKPVSVTVVHKNSVARAVDVVGTLAAVDQVTVSSEADGKVQKINADLGDRVRAGQVLIELDDEKQRYAYEQQQAALARTLAQYGAPDPEHLPDIEQTPEAKRTKADLAQAEQAYARAAELFKRTLIPQQGLDDARTAVETKKANYDASLHNARNLRASIRASEAEMKLAARQLRDAAIRAPFDGYVEKRLVNLGELVKTQMPVMAIIRVDPLKVIAEIPERMAPWMSNGQPVQLHVDAYPDRAFTGKVSRISPAVNTATRAFSFEALVPNADATLKPGTFARVHIETDKTDQVVTVPYAALQYRYGVNRVFVVDGDKLVVRELKVGDRAGDRIEVISGVKAGEQIAVTDVEKLADGMKVAASSRNAE